MPITADRTDRHGPANRQLRSRIAGQERPDYVTLGDRNIGKMAQEPGSHRQIVRLKDDGSVPPDNPFVGKAWLVAGSTRSGIATRWDSRSTHKVSSGPRKKVHRAATS